MSKIIKVGTYKQYMQQAEEAFLKQDLVSFKKLLLRAKNVAIKKRDKIEVCLKLGKLFAADNNIYYSLEALFEVLWLDKNNKEAKSLLMFNFISIDNQQAADYYYKQVKEYLIESQSDKFLLIKHTNDGKNEKDEAINIAQFMDEVFGAVENDELDENDTKELNEFIGNMLNPNESEQEGMELFYNAQAKNNFILHSTKKGPKDILNEMYMSLSEDNLQKVEKIYRETDISRFNTTEKKSFEYAMALAFLFKKEYEKTLENVNNMLQKDETLVDFRMLKVEALSQLKRYNELKENLEYLINYIPNDNNQFKHLVFILMTSEQYDFAIRYLTKNMKKLQRFHLPEEVLGIFYFNSGRYLEAKRIFLKLEDEYGDYAQARNYLYYIKNRIKDGIPLEATFGEWPKMAVIYVKTICNLIALTDNDFYVEILKKQQFILDALRLLIQWPSSPAVDELIDRIIHYTGKAKYERKIDKLKQEIFRLVLTTPFVNKEFKIDVLWSIMCSFDVDKINVVVRGIFFEVELGCLNNPSLYLSRCCALAKSVAIANGLDYYNKFLKTWPQFREFYKKAKPNWKNFEATVAFFLDNYLDLDLSKEFTSVRYSKNTQNKYLEFFNSYNSSIQEEKDI